MRTVLVAGGAGFIGSHLCEALLKKGYRVICVDNLITGKKSNLEEFLKNENFHYLNGDITKQDFYTSLDTFSEINFIFHLASPASPNKKSPMSYVNKPIETMLANSIGTYYLLELSKKHNSLFLFASTSEVYGDPQVSPQSESYFGYVNPNGIRSIYDESKRFGEAMTLSYVRSENLNARVIRIFNTYGPKMQPDDGRVVSNFITQALKNKPISVYGEGTQTRSFCYVSDMVSGIVKAMFTPGTNGAVINLGNPDERSVGELATMIKDLVKSASTISYEQLPQDDPKLRRPDITKALTLLQWSPEVSITQGLEKTIKYFRNSV